MGGIPLRHLFQSLSNRFAKRIRCPRLCISQKRLYLAPHQFDRIVIRRIGRQEAAVPPVGPVDPVLRTTIPSCLVSGWRDPYSAQSVCARAIRCSCVTLPQLIVEVDNLVSRSNGRLSIQATRLPETQLELGTW